MRRSYYRFFITLFLFLISLVIELRWGSFFDRSGVALIIATLIAGAAVLSGLEVLVLTLSAVFLLNWQNTVSPEIITIVIIPLLLWAAKNFLYQSPEMIAIVGAVLGTSFFIGVELWPSHMLTSFFILSHVFSILIAGVVSFLTLKALELFS